MRFLLALTLILTASVWAQADPQALLEEARATANEARDRYEIDTPDQPLWRDTLELAEEAFRLAPDDLEIHRFLALLLSELNWHVRAFEVWNDYLESGGNLAAQPQDPVDAAAAYAEAGNNLGYARYASGNSAAALGYYQSVLRHLPSNPEALYRVGLLNFELGEVEAARGYFQRLAEVQPGNEAASHYLELIAEREQVGIPASEAYRRGLSAYEQGDLAGAFELFDEALRHNARFFDAAAWAGRTALELGSPRRAQEYWRRALELRPGDPGARYFLQMSEAQTEWGIAAGRAFVEGQSAYGRGALAEAADAFRRAAQANPDMVDAWVWAARAHQELGEAEVAAEYWQEVLARRPGDETARFYLEVARQQVDFGREAGQAFVEAVRNYGETDFDAAEGGFRRAVELRPDYAAAWAWLGRLYFTRAQYGQAAEAYARATELEPGNDDYAFFAEEAAILAGEAE